jgi:phage tail P2-like protein
VANLLPPNATPLERNIDAAIAARLDGVSLTPIKQLWDPWTCPAELLPWLAWAEGVDEWNTAWSVAVQRAVIASQRAVRRKRGTKQSVVDAVQAFGGTTVIREWFEYATKGTPHTFDIIITGGAQYVDAGFQQSMARAISRNKPARAHFNLGIGLTAAGHIGCAGVARVANFKRMEFTA